jgi:hypothetical protein
MNMKTHNIKNLVVMVAVVGLFTALVPSLKADLVLNLSSATYCRGSSTPSANQIAAICGISSSQVGSLLCQFASGGTSGGSLKGSYSCQSTLTSFQYVGGACASATCLIVREGTGCYVWNICNWNGTDRVDCNINGHLTECEFYGCERTPCPPPTSSVPEPSTVIAGALLLLPFGVSTVRILRRHKAGKAD